MGEVDAAVDQGAGEAHLIRVYAVSPVRSPVDGDHRDVTGPPGRPHLADEIAGGGRRQVGQQADPGRPGAAAQPAGIPLHAVPQEKMIARPPPRTGTDTGRRAASRSGPAPAARSPAPASARRVSASPRWPKSST